MIRWCFISLVSWDRFNFTSHFPYTYIFALHLCPPFPEYGLFVAVAVLSFYPRHIILQLVVSYFFCFFLSLSLLIFIWLHHFYQIGTGILAGFSSCTLCVLFAYEFIRFFFFFFFISISLCWLFGSDFLFRLRFDVAVFDAAKQCSTV